MIRYNLTTHTWKKGEKAWFLLLALFLVFLPVVPSAHGQAPSSPPVPGTSVSPSDAAGIDALVQILVEKGLVSREEASVVAQKKGEPGASGLAALTELLRTKGVLSAVEADRVAKSAKAPPIMLSSERSRKEFEQITQDATNDIKKAVTEQVQTAKEEVLKVDEKGDRVRGSA